MAAVVAGAYVKVKAVCEPVPEKTSTIYGDDTI
jgi:hypothetical protein